MPYVPSEKSEPKGCDRDQLERPIEDLAQKAAEMIADNKSVVEVFTKLRLGVCAFLRRFANGEKIPHEDSPEYNLSWHIWFLGNEIHAYDGAYLGELNYSVTRFLQRVPKIMVEKGKWREKDEIRYWLCARDAEVLGYIREFARHWRHGISGVFGNIDSEYYRRVVAAYEDYQIIKSGDCFDAPYYTKLVEVVSEDGEHIGYVPVSMKRSEKTVALDKLDSVLVLRSGEWLGSVRNKSANMTESVSAPAVLEKSAVSAEKSGDKSGIAEGAVHKDPVIAIASAAVAKTVAEICGNSGALLPEKEEDKLSGLFYEKLRALTAIEKENYLKSPPTYSVMTRSAKADYSKPFCELMEAGNYKEVDERLFKMHWVYPCDSGTKDFRAVWMCFTPWITTEKMLFFADRMGLKAADPWQFFGALQGKPPAVVDFPFADADFCTVHDDIRHHQNTLLVLHHSENKEGKRLSVLYRGNPWTSRFWIVFVPKK
jgi:hypothetical protein